VTHRRRLPAVAVVSMLALVLLYPLGARAATYDRNDETAFLRLVNQERSARGLSALTMASGARGVARDWSTTMAAADRLHHRPDLGAPFTGAWTRLAENVGVGPSVASLHDAFMQSSGHRANVLGDFRWVGVGVIHDGSRIWVTFNFGKGDADVQAIYEQLGSDSRFSDTAGNIHEANIERLAAAGVTKGCGGDRFCPDAPVTREQFASFMVRAMGLPSAPERFSDVGSANPHRYDIGGLAAAGITKGCGGDVFCPDRAVTRAQMASFLVRALDLPPAPEGFSDVRASNVHRQDVGALAASGITKGCGGDNFCPDRPITRAEMASFLVRAFDL
jgi:hypothetical protein